MRPLTHPSLPTSQAEEISCVLRPATTLKSRSCQIDVRSVRARRECSSPGACHPQDTAAREAGFWPDAVLSGHAHLDQRYTRKVDGRQIPYIVAGSGGFAATAPRIGLPKAPLTVGEYTLVKNPLVEFGYLTITIDMSKKTPTLTITFEDRTNTKTHDTLHLNLAKGTIR